jgi:hypothetical protein
VDGQCKSCEKTDTAKKSCSKFTPYLRADDGRALLSRDASLDSVEQDHEDCAFGPFPGQPQFEFTLVTKGGRMSETDRLPPGRSANKRHRAETLTFLPFESASGVQNMSQPRAVSARSAWAGAARWWFEALDGRRIEAGGASWVAQVVGIHEVRPHLWIQLESEDANHRVVLHVTLETRLDEALTAIAASRPGETGQQFVDAPRPSRGRRSPRSL